MTARLFAASAAFVAAALAVTHASGGAPQVSVRESVSGAYVVAARFTVPESAGVVRAVLTDYPNIPRFMPDVRNSEVLERHDGYARVEQEAVSKFMMFSKRVHLVLDIEEDDDVIRFRDRCNRSFAEYEGSWTLTTQGGITEVSYDLTARPAFSVPAFVLRKLLNRDAGVMIERLRAEISARAVSR